jgi:hypothetical protein
MKKENCTKAQDFPTDTHSQINKQAREIDDRRELAHMLDQIRVVDAVLKGPTINRSAP